ncbi:MAG: hypothetical protein LBM78_03145 [Clostridiales bacterium]|jgi:hypothetical protein|nr:hypothetical protein [Clostridiales bacterium]
MQNLSALYQKVGVTEDAVRAQIKPLSKNGFIALFQRIWRGWLSVWYGFASRHPKLSKAIYMLVFFIVFSEGVTIWQFVIMTFLPELFGSLNQVDFIWPKVLLPNIINPDVTVADRNLYYAIFNEPAAALGKLGGLGNFLAFEIAVFTAQCINFPLQRNITFRSHGNPVVQAIWYFIGWVLISLFVNALWGIINPFVIAWEWNFVLIGLVKTVVTGGLSMAVFFPIFLIIFPDFNKVEKNSRKKLAAVKAKGCTAASLAAAQAAVDKAALNALRSNTEKAEIKAKSLASARALQYLAVVKAAAKAGPAKSDVYDAKIEAALTAAAKAIAEKETAIAARAAVQAA